jgi:hypothetical protein
MRGCAAAVGVSMATRMPATTITRNMNSLLEPAS